MSSILKALKRLEEEKAERSETPVDIARDILRHSAPPHRPARRWLFPVAAVAAVAAVVTAFLLLQMPAVESQSAAVSADVTPPLSPPPAEAAAPAALSVPEPDVVEVRMPPTPPAVKKSAPRPAARPVDRTPAPPAATVQRPAAPARQEGTTVTALPQLAVSGIAFRPEREERLAVVNDLPVMEGTVVEGATVEEILTDRVRFSAAGRTFDVKLGNAR